MTDTGKKPFTTMGQMYTELSKLFMAEYDDAYSNLINKSDSYADFYSWYKWALATNAKMIGEHRTGDIAKDARVAQIMFMLNSMYTKAYLDARTEVSDSCPYYSFRPAFLNKFHEIAMKLKDIVSRMADVEQKKGNAKH